MSRKIIDGICILILVIVVPGALAYLVIGHYDLTGACGVMTGMVIWWVVLLCVLRVFYIGKRH